MTDEGEGAGEAPEAASEEPDKAATNDEAFPWTKDPDECRRCYVFEKMGSPEIDGFLLVENMDRVATWLKDGTVPVKPVAPKRGNLKAVE